MIPAAMMATALICAVHVLLRRPTETDAQFNDVLGLGAVVLITAIWAAVATWLVFNAMRGGEIHFNG